MGEEGTKLLEAALKISQYWSEREGVFESKRRTAFVDLANLEEQFRTYAAEQGFNAEALIDAASKHFESSAITKRTTPLSAEELESLLDDDERTFGRMS